MDRFNVEIDERVQSLILWKSMLWGVFLVLAVVGYTCFLGAWVSELKREVNFTSHNDFV